MVITNFPPQGIATSPQSCYEDSYGILTISGADPNTFVILSPYITTFPLYGTLSAPVIDGTNQWTVIYTPTPFLYGYPLDSFQFTVGQGVVNSTTPTLVLINVVHVNHAPVANSLSVTCAENSFVDITLTASDIDYSWGDNLNVTFLPLSGMTTGATLTQDVSGPNWNAGDLITTSQYPRMSAHRDWVPVCAEIQCPNVQVRVEYRFVSV